MIVYIFKQVYKNDEIKAIEYLVRNRRKITLEDISIINEIVLDLTYGLTNPENIKSYAYAFKEFLTEYNFEILSIKMVKNDASYNDIIEYINMVRSYLGVESYYQIFNRLNSTYMDRFLLNSVSKEFIKNYAKIITSHIINNIDNYNSSFLGSFLEKYGYLLDKASFNLLYNLLASDENISKLTRVLSTNKLKIEKDLVRELFKKIVKNNAVSEICSFVYNFESYLTKSEISQLTKIVIKYGDVDCINTYVKEISEEFFDNDEISEIIERLCEDVQSINQLLSVPRKFNNENRLRKKDLIKIEEYLIKSKNINVIKSYLLEFNPVMFDELINIICNGLEANIIYEVAKESKNLSKENKIKLRKAMLKTNNEFYILLYALEIDSKIVKERYNSTKKFLKAYTIFLLNLDKNDKELFEESAKKYKNEKQQILKIRN